MKTWRGWLHVAWVAAVAAWGATPAAEAAARDRALLWASPGQQRTAPGAGVGCAAVLLSPSWALLSSSCLSGEAPLTVTLVAPGDDAGGGAGGGPWRQWRRATVLRHRNEADEGAKEYPALALARAERPFALGADLQAAPVLKGELDDARRPPRCSIEGWESRHTGNDTTGASADFTEPIRTTIGTVLTHEQCRATTLVEQASQICVEVPADSRLQDGSPLMCGGALVGMHYSATRYNASANHQYNIFTNASDIWDWLKSNVPNLQVVSSNTELINAKPATPPPNSGHARAGECVPGPAPLLLLLLASAVALLARRAPGFARSSGPSV